MLVRSVEAYQTTVTVYVDGYVVVFEEPPVQSRRSTRQAGFRRVSPAQ
jgi:hypothetical protein